MVLAVGMSMPGLDDGGAQQQVGALRVEVAHHALQLPLAHLPVRHRDPRLGQQLRQALAHALDGVDLVVQEVHLAAALELAQHRLADQPLGEGRGEGLDGEALLRRGGDHREVAQSLERQRERARDRRRGEREHVHFGAQRLQRLLLAHAEAVLLVDDGKAQALELHVPRQQLVRADDDVHLARGQRLQRRPWPACRCESATARRSSPASRRSGRRRSGSAARPAAWWGTGSPPACCPRPRRTRRAAPPRSCRSRRRRRSGGPSACPSSCPATTAWMAAAWSGVSSKPKPSAKASRSCAWTRKAWPWRRARLAYSASSSAAVSRTCFAALAFALSHCPLPSLCSGAASASRAGVARDHGELLPPARRACRRLRTAGGGTRSGLRRDPCRRGPGSGRCRAVRAPPGRRCAVPTSRAACPRPSSASSRPSRGAARCPRRARLR